LSTVKSIVLIAEIQQGQDELVAEYFKGFFDAIKWGSQTFSGMTSLC
jgi:hypothetical protein